MISNNKLAAVLKKNSKSLTQQRMLVFSILEANEPLTMRQLQAIAGNKLDRASLYRTLSLFEKLSIVQRINVGWKYKIELSDQFASHHHHLTCLKCQKIIPIREEELEAFISSLSSAYVFKPLTHQLEIQGYCQQCQI